MRILNRQSNVKRLGLASLGSCGGKQKPQTPPRLISDVLIQQGWVLRV
jgi:hypothetical protein